MKYPCPLEWPEELPAPALPPPHTERRDAAAHRQAILAAAQVLFAERGVDGVSMRQIAVAAGIGQGTLYRRYANKLDLCLDLMQERHLRFIAELAERLNTLAAAPALERLEAVLQALIVFLDQGSPYLNTMANAFKPEQWHAALHLHHDGQPGDLMGKPIFVWLFDLFAALLETAVANGEVEPLDISLTADVLLASFNPLVYSLWRQHRDYSPERILAGLRRLYA